MHGKHEYPVEALSYSIVTTGKVLVYGYTLDRERRLFAVVNGERKLAIPSWATAIECVPDRKVEYECEALISPSLRELPDPTPISIGQERPRTLAQEMRRFIRDEVSKAAEEHEAGSFEDEDDFDVDEDPLPLSEYEMDDMQAEEEIGDYDPDRDPDRASSAPKEEPASPAEEPEPATETPASTS